MEPDDARLVRDLQQRLRSVADPRTKAWFEKQPFPVSGVLLSNPQVPRTDRCDSSQPP